MSQLNFRSVTTGYDVKYLLAIFSGGHGLFDLILAALASKIRGAISAKFGSQVPTGSLLQET